MNPVEVSHFNALASTWWDAHGSSRLLHLMNPLRHDFISTCLSNQSTTIAPRSLRYLDIGCGGGIFAESAARLDHTASVTAIDPSLDVLNVAREHARTDPSLLQPNRLQYLHKSIEDLPVPVASADQYDVVSLFEVIEHIEQPAPFLQACLPFVKPGGWMVMSTIARTLTSWVTTKLVAEDLLRMVPRGTHDWNQYINAEEMAAFFRKQNGWAAPGSIKIMGCLYVPGVGWRTLPGAERLGNYFFAVQRDKT